MKKLLLGLLTIGCVWGQVGFTATKTTALSAAAEIVTVQQIAASTTTKTLQFVSLQIDSTVACAITVERNGTAASSTTLTPAQLNPDVGVVATATAWSTSNAGVGTVIYRITVPANQLFVLDLSDIRIPANGGTGNNLTVRTASITGTVDINIRWREVSL
jgi:hypothetical protein